MTFHNFCHYNSSNEHDQIDIDIHKDQDLVSFCITEEVGLNVRENIYEMSLSEAKEFFTEILTELNNE